MPVIIPQRRPGVRVRGFVRAYAPDLQVCGINQDTFMDFLVTFTRASRAPQWMMATNLTAAAAFALPGHAIGCGVGFAIQVVNAIAMEMRGRVQCVIKMSIQSRKKNGKLTMQQGQHLPAEVEPGLLPAARALLPSTLL